jgi:AraC family transcriptional regulator
MALMGFAGVALERRRTQFWGEGPAHVDAGNFSFHRLSARAPEDEVARHTHLEAHFVLVLAGGYMSSAVGAPLVSSAPLLVFNPPGTTHQDRFLHGRGEFLAVSGGEATAQGRAIAVTDPAAHFLARSIARDLRMGTGSRFSLEARALSLTAAVTSPGDEHALGATQPPGWLRTAFELIFLGDDPGLTVQDVAVAVGVHRVHLARVFRTFLECAPGEALRGRRLERAAAVLGHTTASLAEAADATGYADQAHMTRAFRQRLGSTPSAWRHRCCADPRREGQAPLASSSR